MQFFITPHVYTRGACLNCYKLLDILQITRIKAIVYCIRKDLFEFVILLTVFKSFIHRFQIHMYNMEIPIQTTVKYFQLKCWKYFKSYPV